jgi:gamma-glutamyltranspeptidase/glutathione hydrolase
MMRVVRWVGLLAAVGASLALVAAQAPSKDAAPLPTVGRSIVATKLGIVAASQPLAARAGVQMLERGGNAVDAAVAANAAIGLMEPTGNGLGGDLFVLFYEAGTNTLHGLNASGWSPAALSAAALTGQGIKEMPLRGAHTVTVPGVVAGWAALREKYGTLDFKTLLAPAIYYAEEGFPVSEVVAGLWSASEPLLAAHPNSSQTFLVNGRTPRAGEIFRNPDLAKTLRSIAQHGRDGFYKGAVAEAIVEVLKAQGGTMAANDLSAFQPEWVEPIKTTYRGWTVSEIPPQGQGIAALMMLDLMERFPLAEYGFHSPRAMHAMIEAKKLAYADLLHYVGDPRFAKVPVADMLDKQRAARRAGLVDEQRAACRAAPSEFSSISQAEGGDTIYMSVVDRHGNIVSLIQSNYSGFGSGLVPAKTGFMLHNRGGLFTLEPGRPNTLEPRKRPLHTIIPGFMEKAGVRIGFGIMGGWNQAQAHAQFVSNIADHKMTIQQALEAGRFTKSTFDGCDVQIEQLVPETTRAALMKLGHDVQVVPPRRNAFGFGQAVMTTPSGVHFGASEPRHDGAAIPEGAPIR